VRRMAESGVTDFVEVGPGRVLSGLIRRISPDVTTHTVDATDMAEVLRALRMEPV
jgi:[acyl-carrier-protein] S-malonyltransferase